MAGGHTEPEPRVPVLSSLTCSAEGVCGLDGKGLRAGVVSRKTRSGEGQAGGGQAIIAVTEMRLLWQPELTLKELAVQ